MATNSELGTAKRAARKNIRTVELTSQHSERLCAALESAFSLDELRQVVSFGWEDGPPVALDTIVPVAGRNVHDICHDLVLWALHEPGMGLQGLLAAALHVNATNPELVALQQEWLGVSFTAPVCPYPGMKPFTADERARFYGREAEIRQAVDRLRRYPFLAIIGSSGSGKSSLLAAGILPALEKSPYFAEKSWVVRTMRPGAKPYDTFAALLNEAAPAGAQMGAMDASPNGAHNGSGNGALNGSLNGSLNGASAGAGKLLPAVESGTQLLLVVDQYEETFTVAESEQRKAFEEALVGLKAVPDVFLILAARADFYSSLMGSPLWEQIRAHRLEITPPRGDALRQAIALPAHNVGVELDPQLVERLLADAGEEPGVLPFVQETLVMLCERADGLTIGLDAYTDLVGDKGGRSGLQVALAEHAEHVYRDVLASDDERAVAERILLRLVQFGEGRADTRRQQTVDELRRGVSDSAMFDKVLAALTANRLLTVSDQARQVDLSHEALIRGWPRLDDRIKQRRAAEMTRRRLEEKAEERQRLRQTNEAGGLLDVVELGEAEAWVKTPDAKELGVSAELPMLIADSRRAIEAANRKLRRRAVVATVVGFLALGAAYVALFFYLNAQAEAQRALKAEDTAQTEARRAQEAQGKAEAQAQRALQAEALAKDETKRAVSAEARAKEAQAETAKQLEKTQIGESRLLNNLAVQQLTEDPVASIYLSLRALPSAIVTRPLVAEAQATLARAVWTSQERKYLPLLSDEVLSHIYLAPKNIALGQLDGTGEGTGGGQPIVTAGDKLYFVSPDLDRANVSTGDIDDSPFGGFAWGDGGKLLVSTDNAVSVWQDGHMLATYGGSTGGQDGTASDPIACATWPHSADKIAVCRGNAVWLWQPNAGMLSMLNSSFPGFVRNAAWSPDGSRLAAWDAGAQIAGVTADAAETDQAAGSAEPAPEQQRTLWVWDALQGKTVISDTAAGEPFWSAAWSGDGHLLVTTTTGDTATIWNLAGEPVTKTIDICPGIGGVRFVDDQHFVVWSTGGAGQLWDIEGNRIQPPAAESACPMDDGGVADMLPVRNTDGAEQFLKVHNGGAFELWDPLGDGTVRFRGHTMNVLAADRRDRYLATGGQDGTIRIWDAATGDAISVLRGHRDVNGDGRAEVIAVKWLDDQRLLSAGEDGSWRIWQVFDGRGEPLCTDTDQFGLPICMEADSTLRKVDDQVRLEQIRSATWLSDDEIGAFSTLMTGENNIAVRWNAATNAVFAVPITKTVAAAFWLPDGILLSEKKGNVRILDPATRIETPLGGYVTQITAAAQQPGGLLATGDVSGTVRIWDTKKNELLNQWDGGTAAVNTLQWSKDGKHLLSAGNRVSLWEVGADAPLLVWPPVGDGGGEGFKKKKMYAALTPDEKTLAIVFDKGVLVVDAQSMKQCWRKADMYDQPILGVAWVAKGNWPNQAPPQSAGLGPGCDAARDHLLLTWGGDATAKLWDLPGNAAVMSISEGPKKNNPQIQFVAASPSGEYLLTAGSNFYNGINGVIRRWKAWYRDPQELLDEAAQANYTTRELSAAQLAAFSLDQ